MKVVLFCGGMGMRMREYSENVPKPLVPIGQRPIIWHVMKYYAHYGHKDFILCLGYKGETIKEYFLNYRETLTNDFVLSEGGKKIDLVTSDIHDWRITFVDTGLNSNIGMRLKAVQPHLEGEEVFLANYSDGLVDLDFGPYLEHALEQKKTASFVSIRPNQSYHLVQANPDGLVSQMQTYAVSDVWINFGYFVLRQEIFDNINYGEELVMEPFYRLIEKQQLITHHHTGFAHAMDTYKEMQTLNDMYLAGKAPWQVWRNGNGHHK